jgi:hypothetical protein
LTTAPRPPEGYASWLDFAVEMFDRRTVWLEAVFSEDVAVPDRDAIREAARTELRILRDCGGRSLRTGEHP